MRNIQLRNSELQLDHRTVLVIDEASMVGTRDLAPLLTEAAFREAKVVLVGDPSQLQAINAGGLLAGLAGRQDPIVLRANRRQRAQWEQDAIAQLRHGQIDPALAAYSDHGRLHTAPNGDELREQLVSDWYATSRVGDETLMLAQHRNAVDDLNLRARRRLIADGIISGPALDHDGVVFQQGDEIVCERNNRKLGLRNGMHGTITNIDEETQSIEFVMRDGTSQTIPARYLEAGHVSYGYATTIHKAQGKTTGKCFVLATDHIDRELGYVAMSRGRDENRLYIVETIPDPEQHVPAVEEPPASIETIAKALAVSHREHLAVDHRPAWTARRKELDRLQTEIDRLERLRQRMPEDRTKEFEAIRDRYSREVSTYESVVAKRDAAESKVTFKRGEKRAAIAAAQRHVDRVSAQLTTAKEALDMITAQHREHQAFIAEHGDIKTELSTASTAKFERIRQFVDSYRDDPPEYIKTLGPIPDGGIDFSKIWRTKAVVVEMYPVHAHVTDDTTIVNKHGKPVADIFASEASERDVPQPAVIETRLKAPELGR